MKLFKKTMLASTMTLALTMHVAVADSWKVTQTVTPAENFTMLQNGATNGGTQAANAANKAALIVENGSQQELNMSGNALTLNQGGTTANSTQAVNYLNVGEIGDSVGTATQKLVGTTDVTLNQKDSTGTLGAGNLQAVNDATAATITNLTQTAAGRIIKLDQDTQNSNTQAINNAKATTTITSARQEASASQEFDLDQTGAGSNIQAINKINAAGSGGFTTIVQEVTGGTNASTLNQTGTGVSIQAMNMVEGGTSNNTLTQSISGSTTLTQGDGTVTLGAGSVQAGNLMKGDNITAGSQSITTSATETLALLQNKTGSNLQAGNAFILTGSTTGNTLTQTASVGTLEMTQTDATGSFQATNYLGVAIN